jgi:regulatory subunit for Cdc7p protein kinase
LLEKSADHHDEVPQTKFTFDQPLRKRLPTVGQEFESKKQATGNVDMLLRAKGMGMKVWHMEKLQRILQVILEGPASPQAGVKTHDHALPKKSFYQGGSTRQPNLLQLIKNEQHGRTVKEAVVSKLEIVPFKGPHIYIRDMDEKTKPMMVREYPKVPHREDGEWPQFRSVSIGKCPFIEEDAQSRREAEKKRARELQMKQAAHGTARNRDAAVTRMEPPPYAGRKRALAEVEHNGNANGSAAQQLPEPTTDDCGQIKSVVAGAHGPIGRLTGGEPMASGLQASNITSAIRSQMISSTAAAPGAKAGTSKEIHGLQRKVLERNNGPSVTGLAPSRQVTDMTSAAKCNPRTAKQKAQDRLGLTRIHEDEPSDDEAESRQAPIRQRVVRKERRDPKPGYCENCREKFEDFDEVCVQYCWQLNIADDTIAYGWQTPSQICDDQRQLEGARRSPEPSRAPVARRYAHRRRTMNHTSTAIIITIMSMSVSSFAAAAFQRAPLPTQDMKAHTKQKSFS